MIDLAVTSPKRFLNDIVTLPEPGETPRAVVDRRAAVAGAQAEAAPPRKRRRHDALRLASPIPLQW